MSNSHVKIDLQIHEEAKKFSYQTGVRAVVVYGGTPINQQVIPFFFLCVHFYFVVNAFYFDTSFFLNGVNESFTLERLLDVLAVGRQLVAARATLFYPSFDQHPFDCQYLLPNKYYILEREKCKKLDDLHQCYTHAE